MALKHQATARRKWAAAIRQVETHFPPHLPPLLFLTDPQRVPDPAKVAAGLPTGSGVIYRHFGAQGRGRVARELSAVCYQRGLVLLIAADPELAEKVGADGVHWPEKLLGKARAWRGRFPLQTASAHSRRAIWRAEQAGMDAALVSAVFPSNSPSARRVMGAPRFRALACRVSLPLYGLGGVDAVMAERIAPVSGLAAIEGVIALGR